MGNILTKLQAILAIASFSVGTLISCICVFFIEPIGEISNSALGLTSEFLVLAGALLGIKVVFDNKLHKFEAEIIERINKGSGMGNA